MRLFHTFSTFAAALSVSFVSQTAGFALNSKTAPKAAPVFQGAYPAQAAVSTLGRVPEGLADGPGIWVNMWNYPKGDLEEYCLKLHNEGIRNLFLQTSRSNTEAVCHQDELGPIIDACHRYKIRVIAWSFAELGNPVADADKLVAAARFRSGTGQCLDAVAANLEKDLSHAKVEAYSQHLRETLGAKYPMIAVVYSPLNLAPQVAQIPWKMLDHYYDVIAPMNYWNSKYKKLDPYGYTRATIQRVRELVGRPDVEIHVIGDGMGTTQDSVLQFFKACHDGEATSASLYPNFKLTATQLETLSHYSEYFPVNARFRLAALRDLIQTGVLEGVSTADPSQPIARGDFYKLLVRQTLMRTQDAKAGMTAESAFDFLDRNGVLDMAHCQLTEFASLEDAFGSPIDSKEAVSLVAALVDWKAMGNAAHSHHASNRQAMKQAMHQAMFRNQKAHWFAQPAFAAESNQPKATGGGRPLDYLDAAQIVLQASSALR